MSKNQIIFCVFLFCSFLMSFESVKADAFGNLKGIVVDGETGNPIFGTSVALLGTNKGAITKSDGSYLVRKIPIGVYTIKISSLEYKTQEIKNVRITIDSVTELFLEMFRKTSSMYSNRNKSNKQFKSVPKYKKGSIEIEENTRNYSNASNEFGFDLFKELTIIDKNQNIFISPTSIMLALSMTNNGADRDTKIEMSNVLQLSGLSIDDANLAALQLQELLHNPDSNVELSIANSIWLRQGFPFKDEFLNSATKYFDSEMKSLDASSAKDINKWVDSATKGKIKKIVEFVNPITIMFLINAIYFKGIWTYQFEETFTREREFYLLDGSTIKHPLMEQNGNFKYLETDQFQAIRLPYGSERMSMLVFLPSKDYGLENFLNKLNYENWNNWQKRFGSQKGTIVLPRFKTEYEISLNAVLKRLGMPLAFNEKKADFSKMTVKVKGRNVFIQKVKHKTFLEVNEEGTEAAAVTSVSMGTTSISVDTYIPFYMIVDRPFFCMILDDATSNILFMGVIVNPE